jgi:lysophospholipase L1-like esterase
MGKKIIISILLLFSISFFSAAQTIDSLQKKYPFLKTSENVISNAESLTYFFERLKSLSKKELNNVSILHIGDSHIQADYFPETIRTKLQSKFGNAGRGLVFPQKVARTNESFCYKSSSNVKWKSRRIVNQKDTLNIGISGISIFTKNQDAKLYLELNSKDTSSNNFNQIQIFYKPTINNLVPIVLDSALNPIANNCPSRSANSNPISFCYATHQKVVRLGFENPNNGMSDSASFLLHGINLTNNNQGILYHSVGNNGAEFRHYNSAPDFTEESKFLEPQLIIISLGTNEAYAKNYNDADFISSADSLIKKLKFLHPNCSFLLTGAGDANKNRKYRNKNNGKVNRALESYAKQNNIAFYDIQKVMGGFGVINKWFVKGLTSKDKLHLSRSGYELQGHLLYEALMFEFKKYVD